MPCRFCRWTGRRAALVLAGERDLARAERFFARRQAEGYQTPGIFGFYVFTDNQVINPEQVQRAYDNGVVVPIFDGFGGAGANPGADKIAKTTRVLAPFGNEDVGAGVPVMIKLAPRITLTPFRMR